MKRIFIFAGCIFSCISLYADQQSCEREIPSYTHRINFELFRFGYEHIKLDSFYVGAEWWYLWGISSHDYQIILGEAEARVGYNFSFNRSNAITPFLGGGYFKSFESDKKQEIAFSSMGFRYEHVFGTVFNLGINLEGMLGYSLNNEHRSWGNPVWGVDMGVPFTWRFTKARRWDFRLEPFFTQWFGHDKEMVFGGLRSAFGYRF